MLTKRLFGLTPSQFITKSRIAAASRMLHDLNKSVSEIAHACGFYDHSAFTRAFRSATGMTPQPSISLRPRILDDHPPRHMLSRVRPTVAHPSQAKPRRQCHSDLTRMALPVW